MASAPNPLPLDPKYDDYDFPTTAPEPQSGHPGHTTPEQDAQVVLLRSTLEQLGYKDRLDTLTLLRFLRARKFNVEAAKNMYVSPFLPLMLPALMPRRAGYKRHLSAGNKIISSAQEELLLGTNAEVN